MYYKLVLLDNASLRSLDEWNLVLPATVGRSEEATVLLNDPSISRRHCKITTNPHGAVVVQDLGSTNGVYVRDERVKSATVTIGEVFQIGGLSVKIEMVDAPLPEKKRAAVHNAMYGTQRVQVYEIP